MARITNKLRIRAIIAACVFFVFGFSLDVGRLFWIQVINGEEYKAKAEQQQLSDTIINANRGTIYDNSMNILAQSASAWLVYINPSKVTDDAQAELIKTRLSEILDVSEEKIEKALSHKKYGYEKIKGQIEYNTKQEVSTFINENDLYGIVNIDPDTKRYYPYANFASSVLGFTGSEDMGRSGIELKYNDTLTGIAGRVITAKNAQSGAMPNEFETTFDPEQGTSLVLTIDNVIQYSLEKGLRQAVIDNDATSAYGIVMDVKTGAVLGMSTKPDYDLNLPDTLTDKTLINKIAKITDESEKAKEYNNALFALWRNKAISDTYEPGSVFKVITLSAALDSGAVTPKFSYTCRGSIKVADNTIRCHKAGGHGTQNLETGLVNSCNPFFVTIGQATGSKEFYKYFEAFGFSEKSGIDLPAEASPVPNVTFYTGDRLGIAELSSCSFGQTFQVSAIQMITAVSAIANGGHLMTPYLVKSMLDNDGNTIYNAAPSEKRQAISKSTADTVISMMEQVVERGTGKNAYIAGYRVAGKTGTSEKLTKDNEYIASFVGFAPANDPKIAVLIVIDEPQVYNHGGGAIAAPVANEVLEQSLRYLNIEPVYTDEELSKLSASAPNVSGLSVSEAKNTVQRGGFTARVVGGGEKVIAQSPKGGSTLPKNGVIILYTESGKTSTTGTIPDLKGLSISEANRRAVNAGFNIRISGSTPDGEVKSYRQSIAPLAKAELGTIITVYFKTNSGVEDF
ncbi:MAG TPA: penicillin-binding transpeptidase domain-containing protein [Oscillospiraceae bacterium]|nr:penicillin-binding transpeptidase domain-containing protein [Oscillospiraceae bacterium]